MKKKVFTIATVLVLSLVLAASAYALSPIKIVFNGNELESDVAPAIANGRVMVPLGVIAEKFGAEVIWDAGNKTVHINTTQSQEPDKTDMRVNGLESALVPSEAVSAARTWAEGVKTRNGALQYAVMTPELKKEWYQQFEENNWVTGTSSPWVEKYDITEKSKIDNDSIKYKVAFTYTDSTQKKYVMEEYVTVKKQEGKWYVSALEKVDITGKITKLIVNDDKEITGIFVENESKAETHYDKANVMITSNTKIYKGDTDELLTLDHLKEGIYVEAYFGGPVLTIYPVQGGAERIRVFE
ncbi:copper amine oxidase N-terminal domain-containing protein [Desulfallas thermosapovorans]|uniref:Copper amine oxidase-like protein n=1 Tax=Desulfallas thermosapovorans DSM 6562 TaxID=1121431 RepID=A0A5S4ZR26_9FIRM|nr:copper amine oxidase N-terminal domain-containing protein [Desulfallas thermosapovorans]TYO95345.1 copper amine oxidase-like protein [Desulfallas thermosapovorans DSM 6562]